MNGRANPRNLTLTLSIILVLSGVIAVAGYCYPEREVATEVYYWPNSSGAVLFDHNQHKEYTDGCENCHHELVVGQEVLACDNCHEDYSPDDLEHSDLAAIEEHTCNYCHAIGDHSAIQSCRSCHLAAVDGNPGLVTCSSCHDDAYEPDQLSHNEMQEIEEHSCSGCHIPATISAVFHDDCSNCHLTVGPDIFTSAAAEIRCERCHLK